MLFEWDEAKNEANKLKHGIDFADAQYVFADPLYKERYDGVHSNDEDRWVVVGSIRNKKSPLQSAGYFLF
jgi:uncharacterized DUF497 family protein